MKFKIDIKYILVQSLKAIVGYMLSVIFVLYFLQPKDTLGFIGASFVASIVLFVIYYFPKSIVISDNALCFGEKTGSSRCYIKIVDIIAIDKSHKLYNTVTIKTKSGIIHKLHPQDAHGFVDFINKLKSH